MTTWFIRAENGTLCPAFLEQGIAAIGRHEIGDPRQYASRQELIESLEAVIEAKSRNTYSSWAGIIMRFRDEIQAGDRIVTYDPVPRLYHAGAVISAFEHEPERGEWPNFIRVDWQQQVLRDDLTPETKSKLGNISTLFRIDDTAAAELWDVATGARPPYQPAALSAVETQHDLFLQLFTECAQTYFQTDAGRRHLARYEEGRRDGIRNFERALQARDDRQDITDLVLDGLLPHNDTPGNRQRGAWIMTAPVFKGSVKAKYEGSGLHGPDDWPHVAALILDFVSACYDDPANLEAAVETFTADKGSKGFQTAALTPILNAIRPHDYLVINLKSLSTLNYLTGARFKQVLGEYPAANEAEKALIESVTEVIQAANVPDIPHTDLFDCFCHWLVAIRKVDMKRKFWAVGGLLSGGDPDYVIGDEEIGIGPAALGDLSDLKKPQFRKLCTQAVPDDPVRKRAVRSLWDLRKIQPGDGIVAVSGKRKVLATGTVTGSYSFAGDRPDAHRLQVAWDGHSGYTYPHKGWELLVSEIRPGQYEEALCSPDAAPLFGDETFERLRALTADPTRQHYSDNKDAIQRSIIDPVQTLFRSVAGDLEERLLEHVEVKKNVFSRIPKNDYGQGGAWPFYWAAGYPFGGDRLSGPQLYIYLDEHGMKFGFFSGTQAGEPAVARLLERSGKYARQFRTSLGERFPSDLQVTLDDDKTRDRALLQWLDAPEGGIVDISRRLSPQDLVSVDNDALIRSVCEVFEAVFDFFLLQYHDDPWPILLSDEAVDPNDPYSLEEVARDTGFELETLEGWLEALERKRQCVFYGPPGTGKTYLARHLARHIVSGGDGVVELVQFHPAYGYEDFMIGLRPVTREDGALEYRHVPGRFLEFCEKARARNGVSVLIIDEINRANLARVFGELMFLLEYRDETVPLASGKPFRIPNNVRIIGTMNTADRSIALVDHALRRRFAFLPLTPQYEILQNYHNGTSFPVDALVDLLASVNNAIGDANYHLGTSFFLVDNLDEAIQGIWQAEIEPYLEEYFFDQPERVQSFRWESARRELEG